MKIISCETLDSLTKMSPSVIKWYVHRKNHTYFGSMKVHAWLWKLKMHISPLKKTHLRLLHEAFFSLLCSPSWHRTWASRIPVESTICTACLASSAGWLALWLWLWRKKMGKSPFFLTTSLHTRDYIYTHTHTHTHTHTEYVVAFK